MEKYSQWRDHETGIHPFIPLKAKRSRFVLRPLLDVFLVTFRVLFFSLFFPCYYLTALLCGVVPLPALLKRALTRMVHSMGCRTMLFGFGFWRINSSYQRLSRMHELPALYPPGVNIASGDLIIANKLSMIEILYLGFRFAPVFTELNTDGTKVKPISIFTALIQSLQLRRLPRDGDDFLSLQVLMEQADRLRLGPVVVFPEDTNSNGKGLLAMTRLLEDVTADPLRTHVIGFKFFWDYFSPAYTVGGVMGYLYRLNSQITQSLVVRYLSPNDIPSTSDKNWSDQVFQALANLLRQKRTKLNRQDHLQFLAYWDQANKKSYTKSKTH